MSVVVDAHHHVWNLEREAWTARDCQWDTTLVTLAGLDDAERARVLGGTAAEVYRLTAP